MPQSETLNPTGTSAHMLNHMWTCTWKCTDVGLPGGPALVTSMSNWQAVVVGRVSCTGRLARGGQVLRESMRAEATALCLLHPRKRAN